MQYKLLSVAAAAAAFLPSMALAYSIWDYPSLDPVSSMHLANRNFTVAVPEEAPTNSSEQPIVFPDGWPSWIDRIQ